MVHFFGIVCKIWFTKSYIDFQYRCWKIFSRRDYGKEKEDVENYDRKMKKKINEKKDGLILTFFFENLSENEELGKKL